MIRKHLYRKVAIIGAGESGIGAAILAQKHGMEVFVSDRGQISMAHKADLERYGIPYEEGQHSEARLMMSDLFIKSPGIPENAPLIQAARSAGLEIVSEIEFATWYTDARLIGITGTNGKTTTTLLTYHILQAEGLNVGLAGNIGKSFARSVAEDQFDIYVLEISSFQLDDIKYYRNNIGVLLNITPDHLDRYEYDLKNYIRAKMRIMDNQTEDDYFIYNADDEVLAQALESYQLRQQLLPFSLENEVFPGAYIKDNILHIGINQKDEFIMDMEENSLEGRHNRYNTMAASVVSKILEVRKKTIRESLENFKGVEHRLELVATIDGVDYINDSKATNVNSAWYALESINRPIVWIAGGVDKGNDYTSLKPLAKERVKLMIALGTDTKKLEEEFRDEVRTIMHAESMEEVAQMARSYARNGDVVLLSPACASFDLFENYEDRGRKFKEAITKLAQSPVKAGR